MDAKEWLKRGERLTQEISLLEEKKAVLYAKLTNGTAPTDKERISGTKSTADKKDELIDLVETLNDKTKELYRVHKEIVDVISSVPDSVCRIILFERYINLKKFWQIANSVNYSEKYVIQELHPKALKYIEKYIDKN